ncbi:Polyketide cyclase / dehydrase and lipid transport [Streptomyces misionensis]|uniref:Polyketide cyclase / dehydrase and lipid transport n=1 Tax=Streptomyces misionensis TaxID=67331 RepID=A0A1H4QZC2_9ACTN|nr:SRPBCC family protein [Streptomyces misionensis]SEC24983.1 Polyketide cyclase / dehydrase and lipid transport [Streptomyces misionensis]
MQDAADEYPDIHWPAGFTPDDADCHSRARTVVDASAARVFDLLVTAEDWPSWIPGLTDVRFSSPCSGTLQRHCSLEFRLAGRHRFEILVGEIVTHRRLGLSGIASGLQFYQAWLLTPSEGQTLIESELVARGTTAKVIQEAPPAWASRLNTRLPARLKARVEAD